MNPIVSTLIKGMLYFILKAKQGGKYLSRKQVIDKRTGRKTWKYKYKPMQQRAAHEVTRGKFEKVTKLSGDEHKNQIEHALRNGIHVSLHVLRDYPDLAVKYHQQARLAKADKIRAKVKASKVKNEVKVDDTKVMTSKYPANIISDYDKQFYDKEQNRKSKLKTASSLFKEGVIVDSDFMKLDKQKQDSIIKYLESGSGENKLKYIIIDRAIEGRDLLRNQLRDTNRLLYGNVKEKGSDRLKDKVKELTNNLDKIENKISNYKDNDFSDLTHEDITYEIDTFIQNLPKLTPAKVKASKVKNEVKVDDTKEHDKS